jgi:aspartyl-tRNA(Asn)/glutamyl-tRNA(Gln) amidotransferase subunit A
MELTRMTAAELSAALASREVSATEVTRAHLDRIAAVDDRVHAFLHVAADSALEQARDIDARRHHGENLSPLAGVPVAVKDVFATRGLPTTCGSPHPGGLAPALRRHDHAAAQAGRRDHPRQDQHGRVRHGLVHRELRLRHQPQPVGPGQGPGRLVRRLVRRGGRLRGAAGHRHRHRRLDPPARRGLRHRRHQAHLRRLRPGTAWSRSPAAWTRRDRSAGPCSTPPCCTRRCPGTTRWTPPRSTRRCRRWWPRPARRT